MNKIKFFILGLLLPILGFSQHLPTELLSTPVLIEHTKFIGTGFFVIDNSYFYLVTARHIIFHTDTNKILVNEIKLTSYDDPTIGDKTIMKVDIKSALERKALFSKINEDVAVIRLANVKKKSIGSYFLYFDTNIVIFIEKSEGFKYFLIEAITNYNDIHIGDEIFLFGYPVSIGIKQSPQFDISRPLLRQGIVAGKYDKYKTIILDCPIDRGNSGGPVILRLNKEDTFEYKLAGQLCNLLSVKYSYHS